MKYDTVEFPLMVIEPPFKVTDDFVIKCINCLSILGIITKFIKVILNDSPIRFMLDEYSVDFENRIIYETRILNKEDFYRIKNSVKRIEEDYKLMK